MTTYRQPGFRPREVRVDLRLPVVLIRRRGELTAETLDVSSNGLFLRLDEALPLRSLVRIRLTLPGRGELAAHAMVVHVVAASETEPEPGVGLQFWGLNGADRSVWDGFIASIAPRRAPERSGPIPAAAMLAGESDQRRAQTK